MLLLAVPIVIQLHLNAGNSDGLSRVLGVPHNIACPSALIGASIFSEQAVVAAVALFGFQSPDARTQRRAGRRSPWRERRR